MIRAGMGNIGQDLDSLVSYGREQADGIEKTMSAEGVETERKLRDLFLVPLGHELLQVAEGLPRCLIRLMRVSVKFHGDETVVGIFP